MSMNIFVHLDDENGVVVQYLSIRGLFVLADWFQIRVCFQTVLKRLVNCRLFSIVPENMPFLTIGELDRHIEFAMMMCDDGKKTQDIGAECSLSTSRISIGSMKTLENTVAKKHHGCQ